jgi:hypothetical protein
MWNHWVARSVSPQEPFINFQLARWLWTRFGNVFPDLIAAVLMPNHFHLITPIQSSQDAAQQMRKLCGLMGKTSQLTQMRRLWQPISAPVAISDRHHLRRQIRYVALNPCRKGLCADPLEWVWSTYRDLVGATTERPKLAACLAQILGEGGGSEQSFLVRFHAYVSGDPSVSVIGSPFPQLAIPKGWASESIETILSASAASLRRLPGDVQKGGALRRLFVRFCFRHGWNQPALIAEICGMSVRNVYCILSQQPPPLDVIRAADLCLGDRRLISAIPSSDIFRKMRKKCLRTP